MYRAHSDYLPEEKSTNNDEIGPLLKEGQQQKFFLTLIRPETTVEVGLAKGGGRKGLDTKNLDERTRCKLMATPLARQQSPLSLDDNLEFEARMQSGRGRHYHTITGCKLEATPWCCAALQRSSNPSCCSNHIPWKKVSYPYARTTRRKQTISH